MSLDTIPSFTGNDAEILVNSLKKILESYFISGTCII